MGIAVWLVYWEFDIAQSSAERATCCMVGMINEKISMLAQSTLLLSLRQFQRIWEFFIVSWWYCFCSRGWPLARSTYIETRPNTEITFQEFTIIDLSKVSAFRCQLIHLPGPRIQCGSRINWSRSTRRWRGWRFWFWNSVSNGIGIVESSFLMVTQMSERFSPLDALTCYRHHPHIKSNN